MNLEVGGIYEFVGMVFSGGVPTNSLEYLYLGHLKLIYQIRGGVRGKDWPSDTEIWTADEPLHCFMEVTQIVNMIGFDVPEKNSFLCLSRSHLNLYELVNKGSFDCKLEGVLLEGLIKSNVGVLYQDQRARSIMNSMNYKGISNDSIHGPYLVGVLK